MRNARAQIEIDDFSLDVARSSTSDLAQELQNLLTQKLTAYIVGLADGRDIGRYARNERKPHSGTGTKLRELYNLVSMMKNKEDIETIQVWFLGRNPSLGDLSPARLLHESFDNYPRVKQALEKFLATGE